VSEFARQCNPELARVHVEHSSTALGLAAGEENTMSKKSEKEKLLRRLQEVVEDLNELESEARQLDLFDESIVAALEERIDKLEAAISAVALILRTTANT
jgi:DNA repair exonuclease SbcCD ATPase subunit